MDKSKIDRIAENLVTIHPLLYKSISKPMRKQIITPGGMFVMGSLSRHGTMSMSEIGSALMMPKPHVTVIVDKLIDAGFAQRQNDPNDRRVIKISMTEKGLANFEVMKKNTVKILKSRLALLTEDELEILSSASMKVKELLLKILGLN